MKLSKFWRGILLSASIFILMLTIWVLFAPSQFGGSANYVILSGNSMSPNYMLGDLVIVKEANTYKVDDAIAYEHPTINYVFHRIVSINPDGSFILQGDNNSWFDSYEPAPEEVVGKLWLHVPNAGKTLRVLRAPWGFAILTLVLLILLYLSTLPKKEERNRGIMSSNSNQNISEGLFILAVLLFGSLVLGIAALRQPVLNEVSTPIAYEEQVYFRYTANVPGNIYDSTQIEPGEPIFRRLNGSFTVDVDYVFITAYPNTINGTHRLLARVSDSSGWKRTLEISPETSFSGNVFTTSGTLELDNIQAFIDTLEKETGIQRARYTLSIITEIETQGSLDNLPLTNTFSPALEFDVNNLEVVLKQNTLNIEETLNPTKSSALTRKEFMPNTINIFGIQLPIQTARQVALIIGLPSLLLLLNLMRKMYASTNENELERLKIWYGSRLIEARDPSLLERPNTVEIATLEGLVNLAEQDQRTILYLPDGNQNHLFVQTTEQLFHFPVSNAPIQEPTAIPAQNSSAFSFSLPKLLNYGRTQKLEAAYEHALKGWAEAVDRSLSIEGQSHRIADMAYELAHELGIRGKELEDIRMAAYLHKIGMMNVPSEIIEKKNKLSQKELDILRSHPSHAHQNLGQTELLKPIAEAIYYQHERWDGSGQPEGLTGDEIPIGARIISIVNIWNGLSQKRSYREAWSQEDTCRYFMEQAGKQFDPEIVHIFLSKILEFDSPICDENVLEANITETEEQI